MKTIRTIVLAAAMIALAMPAFAGDKMEGKADAKAAMKQCMADAAKSKAEAVKGCKDKKGKEKTECMKAANMSHAAAVKSCKAAK